MCPCLSSKSEYAVCERHEDGLMVPSVYERQNFCLGLYELCPLFLGMRINTDESESLQLIEGGWAS